MMQNMVRYLVMALALTLTGVILSGPRAKAQTVERILAGPGTNQPLVKPGQVAVSPSGTRIAFTDEHRGKIFVMSSDGQLLWTVGETIQLVQPIAVCFLEEDLLLFALRGKSVVFRTRAQDPTLIDTVSTLITPQGAQAPKEIDRILMTPDGRFLILDRAQGIVCRFTSDWKFDRVLVKHGQGKGRIWSPNDLALDLSGNIAVADAGNMPMQVFSPDGAILYTGSWNAPEKQLTWEATAVVVDAQEITWVADATHGQWRLFDRAGILIREVRFTPPLSRPVAMVATADHRLIVVDEHGQIVVLSVS